MCQYRFIHRNTCTPLAGNVDNGGGYACEGREYVQKSVFSSQFSSETKTSLNKYNLQKIYCGFHFVFSSITRSWGATMS